MTVHRILLASTGWLALAATHLAPASPARVLVTVCFLVLCPGAALVGLARAGLRRWGRSVDGLEAAVLVVALSLALGALVSEVLFLAGAFTLFRCLVALAALTSAAALWPVRSGRSPRSPRSATRV